jgi:hypothetical protein
MPGKPKPAAAAASDSRAPARDRQYEDELAIMERDMLSSAEREV